MEHTKHHILTPAERAAKEAMERQLIADGMTGTPVLHWCKPLSAVVGPPRDILPGDTDQCYICDRTIAYNGRHHWLEVD